MTYTPFSQPRPKSKLPLIVVVTLSVLAALLCAGVLTLGSISGDRATRDSAAPIVVPETIPAPASPTGPKATVARSWGDGTWAVGGDIQPGTYVTTAPGDGCYWARLKDFDGAIDSIIANGNLGNGARGRVTIKKTDKGVEFSGGCSWTRA